MKNVSVKEEEGKLIFTVPKELLNESFIQRFVERLRFLELAQSSQLTAERAEELSETIKSVWWEANKERLLAKLEGA